QPFPIVGGILVATLANHFLAALVGAQAAAFLQGDVFRYAIALSFIAMAAWTLIPDKLDEDEPLKAPARMGAFLTTVAAFFIVEMGDKTQLATVALGAKFHSALLVTLGTTLGMMLANVPAVFLGHEILKRVSLALVRRIAAGLFLVIGLWMIVQTAGWV
ncbi:MAG: TMEM165/GDT1 family protein, partial [Phenylobacterium sp.]